MWTFFVTLCIFLNTGFSEIVPTETYTHSLPLLEDDKYHLFWKYDDTSITFEIHVKTLGWVGFGLSPTGNMEGSDMVIAWIKDGETFFTDRHAEGRFEPIVDDEQNWELISAEESGEFTIIVMTRAQLTGDPDDWCITKDTQRLMFAYHEDDPVSNTGALVKHTVRSTKPVQLIGLPPTHGRTLPDDAFPVDFLMTDAPVLSDYHTTYYCEMIKLPDELVGQKHHLVMFEGHVQPGHENFVHHILLYACHVDSLNLTPEEAHGLNGHCYINRTMQQFLACEIVHAGWAVGADKFFFPENTGLPFGQEGGYTLFRLEVHYDNPGLVENVVDNSGTRLWFTPTLREDDAGIILSGMSVAYSQLVPPKSPAFLTQGVCHGNCLEEGLSAADVDEINLFGGLLHSHTAGVGIRLRHLRDGVELPPILEDNAYDFNFQEFRRLPEEVIVKPGDDLFVQCAYNTEERAEHILGGLSTVDEMCLIFIAYYPAVPIAECYGSPTFDTLTQGFFGDDVEIECKTPYPGGDCIPQVISEGPFQNRSLYEVAHVIDWNEVQRNTLQDASVHGDILLKCKDVSNMEYPTHNTIVKTPEITSPYDLSSPHASCVNTFRDLYYPVPVTSPTGSASQLIWNPIGLLIATVTALIAKML